MLSAATESVVVFEVDFEGVSEVVFKVVIEVVFEVDFEVVFWSLAASFSFSFSSSSFWSRYCRIFFFSTNDFFTGFATFSSKAL